MKNTSSVVVLGPSLHAVSGVATHVSQLIKSQLDNTIRLSHFQVGSEGRRSSRWKSAIRSALDPAMFLLYLLRKRPRIVHLNASLDYKSCLRELVYLSIAKTLRRKVVLQIHGGPVPERFFSGKDRLLRFFGWVMSWPDAVVVISRQQLDSYRKLVPTGRVVLIPNAIEVELSAGASRVSHLAMPFRLIYVGRLAESKGIFEIIEALRILRDREVFVTLTLAGDGPARSAAEHAVVREGLQERVEFCGPIFGEAKEKLWRQAHVFVFPTHREQLPYALLEAMACGTVPIVCPVGAIPDVVKDGEHGIFVPVGDCQALADAIDRLERNREELARMAMLGRQVIVDRYAVNHASKEFQLLYRSLLPRVTREATTFPP